jgi:gluconolactonase
MNLQQTGRLALAFLTLLATKPVAAQEPAILAPDASPGLLQERGAGEGPAWHPTLGLLTSGGGDVVRRDLGGRVSVYRKGAGSNGLKVDLEKRLVICEASSRRVTRLETTAT